MSKELREKIIAFLGIQKDKIGVISTVSPENKPESAFVYYTFDLELNIYFACKDSSRKYKNILENKDVAFTIAAGDPPQTLQLEGRASVESSIGAQKRLFEELVALASSKSFAAPITQMPAGGLQFVKISPAWIRFGNFEVRKHGDTFQEINLG
ncbi:MAG TPA: pyridoxamine 5'-phosphate oxidase family protein [Candidatus Paceibacterota bacterium]